MVHFTSDTFETIGPKPEPEVNQSEQQRTCKITKDDVTTITHMIVQTLARKPT